MRAFLTHSIFALAFGLSVVSGTMAAPGDILYAQKNGVNVRSAPNSSSAVVLTLNMGHKLVEFERRAEWVHIGVDRTEGKEGWIHAGLVGSGGTTISRPRSSISGCCSPVTMAQIGRAPD